MSFLKSQLTFHEKIAIEFAIKKKKKSYLNVYFDKKQMRSDTVFYWEIENNCFSVASSKKFQTKWRCIVQYQVHLSNVRERLGVGFSNY